MRLVQLGLRDRAIYNFANISKSPRCDYKWSTVLKERERHWVSWVVNFWVSSRRRKTDNELDRSRSFGRPVACYRHQTYVRTYTLAKLTQFCSPAPWKHPHTHTLHKQCLFMTKLGNNTSSHLTVPRQLVSHCSRAKTQFTLVGQQHFFRLQQS